MTEHEHELIIRVAHRTLRATATPAELDEVEVEVDEIEVELGGRHLRPFVVLRRGERRAEAVVLVPRDDDDVAHATKRALAALRGDPAEPGVVRAARVEAAYIAGYSRAYTQRRTAQHAAGYALGASHVALLHLEQRGRRAAVVATLVAFAVGVAAAPTLTALLAGALR